MKQNIFLTNEYKQMLEKIGVNNLEGNTYKQKAGKKKQISAFITQLYAITKKLSKKRELIFVDCACGKSYLSFAANYVLSNMYGLKIKFICIDSNYKLIDSCRKTAKEMGFSNMEFEHNDLSRIKIDIRPDIVYSLHACDRATDMTIALAIKSGSHNILTVSCCQHTMNNSLRRHPLTQLTRHSVYKERLTDMLSDSMRALILESRGYKANLFEFTEADSTPKNIMLRATHTGNVREEKTAACTSKYNFLKNMFNTEPSINEYITRQKPATK